LSQNSKNIFSIQKRNYLDFSADYFTNNATPNHYKGSLKKQQEQLSKQFAPLSKSIIGEGRSTQTNQTNQINQINQNAQNTQMDQNLVKDSKNEPHFQRLTDFTNLRNPDYVVARTTNKYINNDNIDPCYYMHIYRDMPIAPVTSTTSATSAGKSSRKAVAEVGKMPKVDKNEKIVEKVSTKSPQSQNKNEQISMGFTSTRSTRNIDASVVSDGNSMGSNHNYNNLNNIVADKNNNNLSTAICQNVENQSTRQYFIVSKPTAIGSKTQGYYDESAHYDYRLMSGCLFMAVGGIDTDKCAL
jgi:hypothetical protein